jgi:hypothetical protein
MTSIHDIEQGTIVEVTQNGRLAARGVLVETGRDEDGTFAVVLDTTIGSPQKFHLTLGYEVHPALPLASTIYAVSVEDEQGAQYVLGPFVDRVEAERIAEQHKHTLRLAAWKAEGRVGDVDDPPVFAWVVELLPPGPPSHNPYADEQLTIVDNEEQRAAAADAQLLY